MELENYYPRIKPCNCLWELVLDFVNRVQKANWWKATNNINSGIDGTGNVLQTMSNVLPNYGLASSLLIGLGEDSSFFITQSTSCWDNSGPESSRDLLFKLAKSGIKRLLKRWETYKPLFEPWLNFPMVPTTMWKPSSESPCFYVICNFAFVSSNRDETFRNKFYAVVAIDFEATGFVNISFRY